MSQQGVLSEISALLTITGNIGGPIEPDGVGNIDVLGTGPLLVTGNPGTFSLTISDDGTLPTTFTEDTGTATPDTNNLNVLGDATQGSVTSGAGSTITITNSDATTSQKGVLETSTTVETINGTSTTVSVTPGSLNAKLGPQTTNGIAYGGSSSGSIGWTTAPTDGQLIIGSSAGSPSAASLTSTGSTITITPGANTLNIDTADAVATQYDTDSGSAVPASGVLTVAGTGGITTSGTGSTVTIDGSAIADFDWNVETGTTETIVAGNGYIGNNAAGVTFTLPSTATVGDRFSVTGLQASWTVAQNAGQTIHMGNQSTTTGVGGSLASTNARDVITFICVVTDDDFQVVSSIGNITVT